MIFLKGTRQKYSPMAKITVLPKTEGSPYRLRKTYSVQKKKKKNDNIGLNFSQLFFLKL